MKKQTKPEVFLDHYLSTVGLWRKPIARDGLSLFRAVSEQLFMTQAFHTNLYEACRIVFLHLGKDPETEWTENQVIHILSKMYRRDFIIYECVGEQPVEVSRNNYTDKILLCRVGVTQLDSVYPISFQQSAALCQSIVYEILYRGVFKLDSELKEAVTLIRDQNRRKMSLASNRFDDLEDSCLRKFRDLQLSFKDRRLRQPSPPVPYRIAKALDPTIYRNVELDIWEEEKREQIKESPEYKERFAAGDKCQVILEGEHYHGHIQEISASDNTAIVYIHEFGEKKSVLISCLKTPQSRYSWPSESKYPRRKKDMPVGSAGGTVYYDNSVYSKYPAYQSRSPVPNNYQTSQGYNLGTAYMYPSDMMSSTNTSYIGMDMVPVQNSITSTKTNMNQLSPPTMMQRYGPPAMMQQGMIPNPYMYNAMVPSNSPGYQCVCVPYLESIAVNDVNMNCLPSQDTAGKDLPEVNTLRFFYNLGVENYRVASQGNPAWSGMEMVPMIHPNGMTTKDQLNGNLCSQFALPPPTSYSTQNTNNEQTVQNGNISNQMYYYHPCLSMTQPQSSPVNKRKSPPGSPVSSPSKSQSMSIGEDSLDSNDSGCDSDSASGSALGNSFKEAADDTGVNMAVDLEKKLDNYIAKADDTNDDDANCISSTSEFLIPNKPKSKRKFYMYGNLKLVKPIKDIPPKFLTMLNSLSAEKARCEGEPIIVAYVPPRPYRRYNKNDQGTGSNAACSVEAHTFNPEAKCFVPGDSVLHDPSIIACSTPNSQLQYIPYSMYPVPNKPDGNGQPHSNTSINSSAGTTVQPNTADSNCGNPHLLPSNTNFGDGSKYSMPPFSTGTACQAYPAPYPVYYTAPGSYSGAQTYMAPPGTIPGAAPYPAQLCNMPLQGTQVQAMQTA